jgi:hypothetical protein
MPFGSGNQAPGHHEPSATASAPLKLICELRQDFCNADRNRSLA